MTTNRRRVPVGEEVAGELLREIVSGDFKPGDALPTELQLAARTGVSRLTVREAIGILRQTSIVEIRPGRGTFVLPRDEWSPFDPRVLAARLDSGDGRSVMKSLLEARRLVEVGVAELAADRRTPDDITAMRDAIERMTAANGDVDSDDVDNFVDGDLEFHAALMVAAGNPVISMLFAPVRDLLKQSRRTTSRAARDRAAAISAHERILKAVEERDSAAARAEMAHHLRSYGGHEIDELLAQQNATSGK